MFVYNQHSFLLHIDWPKLTALFVDGEPQGHWRWNSNSRDMSASFLSFFASHQIALGELALRPHTLMYIA